jgi:hypothetical protein
MLFENFNGKPSPLEDACGSRPEFMETFHTILVCGQQEDIAYKNPCRDWPKCI